MEEYTLREMMTIVAAREIKNGDIVFSGTGISMLAAMAAKNINAPESVMFFETGAIDSKLDEIPLSVADLRVMYLAATSGGLFDAFTTMQIQSPAGTSSAFWGRRRSTSTAISIQPSSATTSKPKTRFPGQRRRLRCGLLCPALHHFHAAGEEKIRKETGLFHEPRSFGRRRRPQEGRVARGGSDGRDHEHGGLPV